jgi:alpha-glucosidase
MAKQNETLKFFHRLGGDELVSDVERYAGIRREQDRRFASVKADAAAQHWRIAGAVETVIPYERGVRLACEYAWVELEWLAVDCVRVRMVAREDDLGQMPFSYAIDKTDWPEVSLNVRDLPDRVEVHTEGQICRIAKRPLHIALERPDGRVFCMDAVGMQQRPDGGKRLSLRLHSNETSYGLGERATGLNLRGKQYRLWNTDKADYDRGDDPIYYSIPFYLGVHEDLVYGVLWDNSFRGIVDVGHLSADELIFEAEGGPLVYYLFTGARVESVLQRYTELTGRIKLPPAWFLGYQQSRFSYYPQDNVLKLAQDLRRRRVPCDVIYLDIHYMDGFRVFTWDPARFPDFEGMIKTLHAQGFKVITILDPGVKIDPDYGAYNDGLARNAFLKYPDGQFVEAPVWAGMSHFPDFTRAAVRTWWADQCEALLKAGVDGIWNDMCEPVVFTPEGEVDLPDYVQHDHEGFGAAHVAAHNVYGMLMGRASAEALARHKPDKRPVNMIRAGFAGAQRYAASWTGDNAADWDHLRLSISMALNMGLSGAPMTGPDIGGFRGNVTPELFTRWLQVACFLPYFRGHSSIGTNQKEPWAFGQPYEVINRLTIALRYRFIPYIYSIVALAKEYGSPVVRPLFMADPHNPEIRTIDDCYMLGDALLVAPIVEAGKTSRRVYLPAGEWYDFWTNERYDGGEWINVVAPLERLPLFVRAGTVLPLWDDCEFIDPSKVTALTLRVYPGEHETVIYEDHGEGRAYESGDYRWVYMNTEFDDDGRLLIHRRVAGRFQPAYQSLKVEVVGLEDEPDTVKVDRQGAPLWFYDDDLLEFTVSDFQKVEITEKPTYSDPTVLHRPRFDL